jgi:hypothetical protein
MKKACTSMRVGIDDFINLLEETRFDELGVEISPNSSIQF